MSEHNIVVNSLRLSSAVDKATAALKSAQLNVCARKPLGASSDPDSPKYNHDAFMWDFYQSAIDALKLLTCKTEY